MPASSSSRPSRSSVSTRPTAAQVSIARLRANYTLLCHAAASSAAGAPEVLAVVKANAYGHGVELCGPALAAAGARWLGVTSVEEGALLRRALGMLPSPMAAARILVMSGLWEGEAKTLLDRALTPQVWEPYQLRLLDAAARAQGKAAASVRVHIEVDTGMARQGVAPGAPLAGLLAELGQASTLRVEGVSTHFSAPEQLHNGDTAAQVARFAQALAQVAAAGLRPEWLHAGNSATVFDPMATASLLALSARHGARLMLRPGLALYGYAPHFTPPAILLPPLQPVLSWSTRITSLRSLSPGEGVGYNSTFRASRPTRLALVPAGYADGLSRLLSNRGKMLVHGQSAPIAGRVSMDQTMLDVTDVPGAAIGDEVAILGRQAGADGALSTITAEDHAGLCGTIPYEVLCNISARVPRHALD